MVSSRGQHWILNFHPLFLPEWRNPVMVLYEELGIQDALVPDVLSCKDIV